MKKDTGVSISYPAEVLHFPLYLVEEELAEDDVVQSYTLILTGTEKILETMTFAEYLKRAATEKTQEWWTAPEQVQYIQQEINELIK